VTNGTDAAVAAKSATIRIPIVMSSAGDPMRSGLVASLGRPGGNITGYSIVAPELDAKRLTLVRELLPNTQRVVVLVIPAKFAVVNFTREVFSRQPVLSGCAVQRSPRMLRSYSAIT
jgi:ABC-type uncharacterized transport system substrate-binding protein